MKVQGGSLFIWKCMNNLIGVIIFNIEIIFCKKSQFLEHQPVYLKVQKKIIIRIEAAYISSNLDVLRAHE